MILTCKNCGHKLTKELYPERDDCLVIESVLETIDGLKYDQRIFKKGCFYYGSCYYFGMSYDVSTFSCTGVRLQPYKPGSGCCANSFVDFFCSSCDTVLGDEHNDCYDAKMLTFDHKKVNRWYKK